MKWLSVTKNPRVRVVLVFAGLVVIFAGMLEAYNLAGVPHINRPHEYCPDMELSCPGNKWSMQPLSYVIFFGGCGVAMAWTAAVSYATQD